MAYSPPINEKQLIADLQNPSTAKRGFDLLIRTYADKMYWVVRRMVMSHDDTNDILQNCFLKVWSNLQNFRGDAKLSTWLYKIAVNETINFLNKQRAMRNIVDDCDDTFLLNNIESDDYFDGDQLQIDLQRAIAKLPEKQRLVFNMKYFDDMKYEEISEVLGTSVGALKASYHHAVKKLTQMLDL